MMNWKIKSKFCDVKNAIFGVIQKLTRKLEKMILKISKLIKNIIDASYLALQKPRWQEYEDILNYAAKNGYVVTSMIDWYQNYINNPKIKVLILRHDIDYSIKSASKMMEIERKLGANSTFYFRWSTIDKNLIEAIKGMGSEVGIHYETLASYAIKNKIQSRSDFTERHFTDCQAELRTEIIRFKDLFGPIYSAASHGDAMNRKLGIPNNILLENVDLRDYGLIFEAYDKELQKLFDVYISDASVFNGYWRYGVTPIEAIDKQKNIILLLTHPIHWEYYFKEQMLIMIKYYLKRIRQAVSNPT